MTETPRFLTSAESKASTLKIDNCGSSILKLLSSLYYSDKKIFFNNLQSNNFSLIFL